MGSRANNLARQRARRPSPNELYKPTLSPREQYHIVQSFGCFDPSIVFPPAPHLRANASPMRALVGGELNKSDLDRVFGAFDALHYQGGTEVVQAYHCALQYPDECGTVVRHRGSLRAYRVSFGGCSPQTVVLCIGCARELVEIVTLVPLS